MTDFSAFLSTALLSLALGALIGLERERTSALNIGVRSFALISFFGFIATIISKAFLGLSSALVIGIGFLGTLFFSFLYYYFRSLRQREITGITTALAVPLAYLLGVLVGLGYSIEAVASSIAIALLLVQRQKVHAAVKTVTIGEIVDGLIFAIIAFVIFPLLPSQPQQFLGFIIDVQRAWKIVVVGSLLSFGAHLLTKYLHEKGALLAAFFGGAVSSIGIVYLFIKSAVRNPPIVRLALVASSAGAYFADLVFLLFVDTQLLLVAGLPVAAATAVLLAFTFVYGKGVHFTKEIFSKPLSLAFVAEFAILFFLVKFLSDILINYWGETGLLVSSLIGGLASSSAVFASIVALFSQGTITGEQAAVSMLLGLAGSMAVKTLLVAYKSNWASPAKIFMPLLFSLLAGFIVYLLV